MVKNENSYFPLLIRYSDSVVLLNFWLKVEIYKVLLYINSIKIFDNVIILPIHCA